jgi:hypothetical protein
MGKHYLIKGFTTVKLYLTSSIEKEKKIRNKIEGKLFT